MKKFLLYSYLVFEILILVFMLTVGLMFYVFLLLFNSDSDTKIQLSDFIILTPIYLFPVISTIGSVKAIWKILKSRLLTSKDKIFIGLGGLSVILISGLGYFLLNQH